MAPDARHLFNDAVGQSWSSAPGGCYGSAGCNRLNEIQDVIVSQFH